MTTPRIVLLLVLACAPLTAPAAVTDRDLPAGTVWYVHADVKQMRETASGQGLYDWLNDEVFVEINEEIGIDLGKEVDRLTAFNSEPDGTVILIEGPVSREAQDKLLALAREESSVTELKHGRHIYFYVQDDDRRHDDDDDGEPDEQGNHIAFDIEDGAYVSFALRNKLLITGNEEQMKELLDNKGRVTGSDAHEGALFVLTADKTFVQAGLNTDEAADSWDSNIIRNTEQAALMISDFKGKIAVEAKLVSTDKEMAQALGGIANGLIAMQAFNSELDENIKSIIANTKILVEDNILSVSTVLTPELILDALND